MDTEGHLVFLLPNHPTSLCIQAKVVHVVVDRQRAEVDCGMGIQFGDLDPTHRSLINLFLMNQQSAYLQLRELLRAPRPDAGAIAECAGKIPLLRGLDLAQLRYKVNRICTIFEASSDLIDKAG